MSSPRERLVYTMVKQLREHGVEGTGLRPLVAEANAPWGSLRHYFPGGKDQLVSEALEWSGSYAADVVATYLRRNRPTPRGLVRVIVRWWINDLEANGYARGCPVAAAVVDCAHTNQPVRVAAERALETWQEPIRQALAQLRFGPRDAEELSTFILSGLAGAIVLSRARRSTEPLRILERQLIRLLTG